MKMLRFAVLKIDSNYLTVNFLLVYNYKYLYF